MGTILIMKNLLKNFFYPTVDVYRYEEKKEIIISQIAGLFNNSNHFFSEKGLRGEFTSSDTFEISPVTIAFGSKQLSAHLTGKITYASGITEITTHIRTSRILYLWFFISLVYGIFGIFHGIQTYSLSLLFIAITILAVGPVVALKIANFQVHLLKSRFLRETSRLCGISSPLPQ